VSTLRRYVLPAEAEQLADNAMVRVAELTAQVRELAAGLRSVVAIGVTPLFTDLGDPVADPGGRAAFRLGHVSRLAAETLLCAGLPVGEAPGTETAQ
jgi:hypothetical protein